MMNIKLDPIVLGVNTIKMLSIDAVERANSGHPGAPMGLADLAFMLWTRYLHYNPQDPRWPNRDRFILSCGHASMLLYSLLHLAGFELSLEEIRRFRQWESKTPGHPEFGLTPGVETTTGPLGQGISNAVGFALSQKMLAARFNTPEFSIIDHKVYVLASDGDMMEGVQAEAASLAGHLKLGNLIVFYDSNQISIAGKTDLSMSEDVGRRFEAYGWAVQHIDGHDHEQILEALKKANAQTEKPNFIVTQTHIAHGAPTKQDTADAHGAPLGKEEVAATKKAHEWPAEKEFYIPEEVRKIFQERAQANRKRYEQWQKDFQAWGQKHPELLSLWNVYWNKSLPKNLEEELVKAVPQAAEATRVLSGAIMQKAAALVPNLVGGSADLEPSTKTLIKNSPSIAPGKYEGRNIHFGVREHAMGALINGMAYDGAFIPYGATFLVFADYMRPSIRLAAIAKLQSIFIFTHDSIFVGEDGPTHQPIEQVMALRAIPHLHVIRPADGVETAVAWAMVLRRTDGPTALILTRQKLPAIARTPETKYSDIAKGAYVVADAEKGKPELVLIGTGSELHLCLEAKAILEKKGIQGIRVVSMPCVEVFLQQNIVEQNRVLPKGAKYVAVEAGISWGWHRILGKEGLAIGREDFGASAPGEVLGEKFGFTGEQVAARIHSWLKG